jgi:hypothetical protein
MKGRLERVIAALEVEAIMMESHAKRLSDVVPHLPDPEQQRELVKLAREEADRAEEIRRQVRLLRDHLRTGSRTEP